MDRYALLLVSMSLADAKVTLGFPPDAEPSPTEIQKAWREMAFKNHPDRGGDPDKMVEVNVAKDVLEGKQRPTYERPAPGVQPDWGAPQGPRREPPKKQEVTFDEAKAKANVPSGVNWMFVTDSAGSGYSSDEHMRRVTGYVFYGQTDSNHVFVAVENLQKEDYYIGAGPGIDIWSMKVFSYPRSEGELLQPAWLYGNIVKAFKSFQYVEKRFNSRVIQLPEGWHFSAKFPHGRTVSIKHWLVNQGLVSGDDPSVVTRKNVVELTYRSKGFGEDEKIWFILTVNGKDYELSASDSKKFLMPNKYRGVATYIFGDYFYDGSKKMLSRIPAAKKVKLFTWMSKNLTDLPPAAKAVIDAEAAKATSPSPR
jgi:hypothetical protein